MQGRAFSAERMHASHQPLKGILREVKNDCSRLMAVSKVSDGWKVRCLSLKITGAAAWACEGYQQEKEHWVKVAHRNPV